MVAMELPIVEREEYTPTDTSTHDLCGCSLSLPNQQPFNTFGHWTHQEAQMSINWRELKTTFLTLRTFPHFHNMRILIRTDNTTSKACMNKQGGTRPLLLIKLATDLWRWRPKREITIQSTHVQGISKKIADSESRRPFQKNNWTLRRPVFCHLQRI